MTKKHFIALADHLRCDILGSTLNTEDKEYIFSSLAYFCASQNNQFKRDRWLGYIHGTNGPNGGRMK